MAAVVADEQEPRLRRRPEEGDTFGIESPETVVLDLLRCGRPAVPAVEAGGTTAAAAPGEDEIFAARPGAPNRGGLPVTASDGFDNGTKSALPCGMGLRKPINRPPSGIAARPSMFSPPPTSGGRPAASDNPKRVSCGAVIIASIKPVQGCPTGASAKPLVPSLSRVAMRRCRVGRYRPSLLRLCEPI